MAKLAFTSLTYQIKHMRHL